VVASEGSERRPDTIEVGVFTFVIGLVVVGATLAIAARVVMREEQQPATKDPEPVRAGATAPARTPAPARPVASTRIVAPPAAVEEPSWWAQVRAVAVLVGLLACVGAFVALVVLLAGVLLLTALRAALQ